MGGDQRNGGVVTAQPRACAGGTVRGEVVGAAGPLTVALVRVERTPAGERLRVCDSAVAIPLAEGDGPPRAGFELELPAGAPPSTRGRRCSLGYRVQPWRTEAGRPATGRPASVEVLADERPHVDPRLERFDRFLPSYPGPRFHVELSDGVLVGGGRIAGRLHREPSGPAGEMTVTATCREAWRCPPPWIGGTPCWHDELVWSATATVRLEPDRAWAPFSFALPGGLPPAVEAGVLAWRYGIGVRQPRRLRPAGRAALTPLLFEAA